MFSCNGIQQFNFHLPFMESGLCNFKIQCVASDDLLLSFFCLHQNIEYCNGLKPYSWLGEIIKWPIVAAVVKINFQQTASFSNNLIIAQN